MTTTFPVASIVIRDRQRKELRGIDELAESIRQLGLINPIAITASGALVAGERRLTAIKKLGWDMVEVRIVTDDERSRVAIELAENVMRDDMSWQDQVEAAAKLVAFFPTASEAAAFAGWDRTWLGRLNSLWPSVESKNAQILAAPTLTSALNILERQLQRQFDTALADILDDEPEAPAPPPPTVGSAPAPPPPPAIVHDRGLDTGSFLEWAPTYSGRKFNLFHVDFPYGVNIGKSDQMAHEQHTAYDDSPELFWSLSNCLFQNISRLSWPSAHILFWYSSKLYTDVFNFWNRPPFVVNPTPLIWHKSDNAGVLPDPKRGPRNTYETALLMTIGDRFIVKAKANSYSAPTAGKALHFTEKPEPVLRHFFEMLVDEHTEMLDPTCGSGSALRAAESLGAKHVYGMEIDDEVATRARQALKASRLMRRAA